MVADTAHSTEVEERPSMFRRWARLPWWGRITIVYVLSRLVTTAMFAVASLLQAPDSRFGAFPSLGTLAAGWDGQWYWWIATYGYPTQLPLDDAGRVAENAWAFMPVYPGVVKALSVVTFLPWPVMAVIVSLCCGLGAALLFHRLLRIRLGDERAMFAVVLFCIAPLSALFQVAYAESMFLLLLTLALLLLVTRRYGWLLAVIPVMAFTRPGVLAFSLLLGLHLIVRIVTRHRDPLARREVVLILAGGALAAVAGFAWMVIAGLVTGTPDAYLETELAWRAAFIGEQPLVPFSAWIQGGQFWFGDGPGIAVVAAVFVGSVVLLFLQPVRRLGADLRLWVGSYLLYLFAVFFPQTSVFRLLVPVFPLLGAVAVPRNRWYRGGVVIVSLALQWCWIFVMYGLANAYWTIP
ncbi:hypothetical protein [Plantibacter sp. MCCC 1A11337]|uniref:hypothetical protein n=1 Tax=Plantibacter sp. MCCC 1A11337 TaxID=2736644 RepID=UPI0020C69849|nr:hypothetical protein [Plantibacter sp. MCCC 1A11337]